MSGQLTRAAYDRLIEDDIARVLTEMQPSLERDHVVSVLRASAGHEYDLLAEIDKLRSLPVLRTCGGCRHIWGEGSAGHTCTHERGNEGPVSPRAAPPSWCPLRRGER